LTRGKSNDGQVHTCAGPIRSCRIDVASRHRLRRSPIPSPWPRPERNLADASSRTEVKRIAGIYAIEKERTRRANDERVRLRQAHARSIVDDLESWLHAQLPRISGKSELAKAIRYALARIRKLRPYLDLGCLEANNNGAERALKAVALGRKNYIFVGSAGGGKSAAMPTP